MGLFDRCRQGNRRCYTRLQKKMDAQVQQMVSVYTQMLDADEQEFKELKQRLRQASHNTLAAADPGGLLPSEITARAMNEAAAVDLLVKIGEVKQRELMPDGDDAGQGFVPNAL